MTDRAKAIEVIRSSGVLNEKMSLGDIMNVANRLEELDPGALASWTFIGPNWVYKGDDISTDKLTTKS